MLYQLSYTRALIVSILRARCGVKAGRGAWGVVINGVRFVLYGRNAWRPYHEMDHSLRRVRHRLKRLFCVESL